MNNIEQQDIEQWVEKAPDSSQKEFRQAIHTILAAISSDPKLNASMVLKGGILLAIRYASDRFTKDIDLSTDQKLSSDFTLDIIVDTLNNSLALTVEELDYSLDCRVQSAKKDPKDEDATFPSIKLRIGYAYKGTPKHKRLLNLSSSTAISIDYSLNESIPNVEEITISSSTEDRNLLAYSLSDLIAEKYRSLLQQESRNRERRQDIYDIILVEEQVGEFSSAEKLKIMCSLITKCRARGIEPDDSSIDSAELKKRAQAQYHTLADEIPGDLPDFDQLFAKAQKLYKSLPWELKDNITQA